MKPVQTVQVRNPDTVGTQDPAEGQQAQRFGPEIIGSKVMNPGIDQQDVGGIRRFHRFQ
jgi:hypothetical protein